jgi:hypothetical protein
LISAIEGGGIDVKGLVVDPAWRARHAVFVDADGDADEGADGGGGGDEASAGKDATVGGFVAGKTV